MDQQVRLPSQGPLRAGCTHRQHTLTNMRKYPRHIAAVPALEIGHLGLLLPALVVRLLPQDQIRDQM